jgi:hypothetical protein
MVPHRTRTMRYCVHMQFWRAAALLAVLVLAPRITYGGGA